jgi:hypothetical protein
MSDRLGTYSFLPWLRVGIASQITAQDQDPAVAARASIGVTLHVTGAPVGATGSLQADISRQVELYGPGDIIGIDSRAIVKTEPRNWVTNFEPNYLAGIDFYDEDFAWRYTPAAPLAANGNRLKPWLALLVLKEAQDGQPAEFADGGAAGRPLPFIVVQDAALFPASADLWAWAHVHVNASLIDDPASVQTPSQENGPVLDRFEQTLAQNPDLAYSRILSPRKLAPNTAYHAFLVPAYETGRLAGLGLDPAGAPHATHGAWDPYPSGTRGEPDSYPVYYRWYFRTSAIGDFEYLVRLIEPRPMDSRVGRRDLDVQWPGVNLPGIGNPALGGVLKLGGALQVPAAALSVAEQAEVAKYENWDEPYPDLFQQRLAEFVNLADAYSVQTVKDAHDATQLPGLDPNDDNPDPLITPPLYGRWHALTQRLLTDRLGNRVANDGNWVHELNLDPRFRAAAGFGTEVIQGNQEAFMEAAWAQIGDVIDANSQIRWAQVATAVSAVWQDKHLAALAQADNDRFLRITAPVDSRLVVGGVTRRFGQQATYVPRAVLSAPMRRITRPRGRLVRTLQIPAAIAGQGIVARLNRRLVRPAPPKVTPADLPTVNQLAARLRPPGPLRWLVLWLRRTWRRLGWLTVVLPALALLAVLVLLAVASIIAALVVLAILVVAAAVLWPIVSRYIRQAAVADSVAEGGLVPEAVDAMPASPDFELTLPGTDFTPTRGSTDSRTGARFKQGLRDSFRLVTAGQAAVPDRKLTEWNIGAVSASTLAGLDVTRTIPGRTLGRVRIPARIRDGLAGGFAEVMAYPEFDLPMYQPLTAISAELFLPNLQFVTGNSISLLENNQRFIEAYMVGLNHEMARELLWREYPTDQRGSYFRQFWDVSTVLAPAGADPQATREALRDIPPLDGWTASSVLGQHNNRQRPDGGQDDLVLVIRGELLKKYPTAVILAHRADWQHTAGGAIDKSLPRRLAELTDAEAADPPRSAVRTPLYEARIDPDIYFFGFDLTADEARGETAAAPDDPGWFFVIQERPGEPRFGLDVGQDGAQAAVRNYWNDFSWADIIPGLPDGGFLAATAAPTAVLTPPPGSATPDQQQQHAEDIQIHWDASIGSAELAYILCRVPVLVAVHASRMLAGVSA